MNTDSNNLSDATTFPPSEPTPCATGCGFFGTTATHNLCSKCYQHHQTTADAKTAVDNIVNNVTTFNPQITPPSSSSSLSSSSLSSSSSLLLLSSASASDSDSCGSESAALTVDAAEKRRRRCLICNKKVGVVGFKCRCGDTFCGNHRYPEKHGCEFDFKRFGRDAIAKANPMVKADKIDRI